MTIARSKQVNVKITTLYHCISKCARNCYLLGKDHSTGKDYSYRQAWVKQRLVFLCKIFAIESCAYSIMSNHLHLVLNINQELANSWSNDEIKQRWQQLSPSNYKKYYILHKKGLNQETEEHKIQLWREKLTSLSDFHKYLKQHIAALANNEEKTTGVFWNGRFKSKAILGENDLLRTMIYVDLNPIRAQISETPEDSDYTSVKDRISYIQNELQKHTGSIQNYLKVKGDTKLNIENVINSLDQPSHLKPFSNCKLISQKNSNKYLNYSLFEYLQVIDSAGRDFNSNKKGKIPNDLPPLLERLNFSPKSFLKFIQQPKQPMFYASIKTQLKALGKVTSFDSQIDALDISDTS